MGKAIRWLKGLFGIKLKDIEIEEKAAEKKGQAIGSSGRGVTAAAAAAALCNNPTTIPPNITPAEAAWLSSFFSDKEQSKHAIAVAAATAAAADAAAAAAHAAVEVVRLTSQAGGAYFSREKFAAVKIQAAFRGYLARKALRCLKGLVKIQALVRGYLVRKQATATFHSMQALMRAQASVRAQKFRASFLNHQTSCPRSFQSRKSIARSDETTRSGRHPSPFEVSNNGNDDNPKIVEIDSAFRPAGRRSRRANTWVPEPEPGDEAYGAGPSFSSPLSCRIPARSSITDCRHFQDSDWGTISAGDEYRFSTAQSTPRIFPNSCGSNTPVTPANSVCVESSFFRSFENFPNYMADTEAFRAKLRSQSAPKQRPEPGPGPKKRLSPMIMESRASVSGGRMRISCSQAQEVMNFKNAVMGRLDRSIEFSEEEDVVMRISRQNRA